MCTEYQQRWFPPPGLEAIPEIFFYKRRRARYCVGSLCNNRWHVLMTVGVSLLVGLVPMCPDTRR